MYRLLEEALRQIAIPYGSPSYLSAFTHKEIAFAQRVLLALLRVEVHLGEIGGVNVVPLNIDISKVRGEMRPNDSFLIKHLPQLHCEARVDRRVRPSGR
jgi:hypothetical protein